VLIANDNLIAGILNRNGLQTGNGNRWTRERVTSMRSNYRIPVFKPYNRTLALQKEDRGTLRLSPQALYVDARSSRLP
jgi:hypothetical protein